MRKSVIGISIGVIVAAFLAFHFFARPNGYVKIDALGFDADVNLQGGWRNKTVTVSAGEPVRVRAAAYKPERAVLRAEEDSDTWWAMLCRRGRWGKLAQINVAKGETTTVKLGPPLTVHTDVQRKGQAVSIGVSLIGRAGEHWAAQVLTPKGPLPAPKLKIVDETGTVLAAGTFEYG